MEGVIDVLASQGVQHMEMIQIFTRADGNPVQQGLISVNGQEPVFWLGDSHAARYIFGCPFLVRSRFKLCSISKFSWGRCRGCCEACLRFIFCFVFNWSCFSFCHCFLHWPPLSKFCHVLVPDRWVADKVRFSWACGRTWDNSWMCESHARCVRLGVSALFSAFPSAWGFL